MPTRDMAESPLQAYADAIQKIVAGADCVLVVPPFASALRPAFGPHILQGVARLQGMQVRVLYANAIFAAMIGIESYEGICDKNSQSELVGERVFVRAAHGLPRFGMGDTRSFSDTKVVAQDQDPFLLAKDASHQTTSLDFDRAENETEAFCECIAGALAASSCTVVGLTSSFEQINSSIAILRHLKQRRPNMTTLLGGANCEGAMGHGLLNMTSQFVDFIFSGESEQSFPKTLREILDGLPPACRVIEGTAVRVMDDLPAPDYRDYFEQLTTFLPDFDQRQCWLQYETSRGCWWGAKQHCTFCGLNGETLSFREKSPSKVMDELQAMVADSPTKQVAMADNIMPHSYHKTLIPMLIASGNTATIFYEQKSNLSLDQVNNLKLAGVTVIQPGIESLSTPLLQRMKKGVTAAQNVALLRYSRICHVIPAWNLLTEFPGDSGDEMRNTLAILPRIRHLNPPTGLSPLSIDRFSPYFDQREHFEITGVRPWEAYYDIFPPGQDVASIAYHFRGTYQSGSRVDKETARAVREEVASWRQAWASENAKPMLLVTPLCDEMFVLMDTRLEDQPKVLFLNRHQAAATLMPRRLPDEASEWAIANGFALEMDGRSIPLAIASGELLQQLNAEEVAEKQPRKQTFEILTPAICA